MNAPNVCRRFEVEGVHKIEMGEPLSEHTMQCADCMREHASHKELLRMLGEVSAPETPPPALMNQLFNSIDRGFAAGDDNSTYYQSNVHPLSALSGRAAGSSERAVRRPTESLASGDADTPLVFDLSEALFGYADRDSSAPKAVELAEASSQIEVAPSGKLLAGPAVDLQAALNAASTAPAASKIRFHKWYAASGTSMFVAAAAVLLYIMLGPPAEIVRRSSSSGCAIAVGAKLPVIVVLIVPDPSATAGSNDEWLERENKAPSYPKAKADLPPWPGVKIDVQSRR